MNLRGASLLIGIFFASLLLLTALNFVLAAKLPDYVDPCEWIAYGLCHIESGLPANNVKSISGHSMRGVGAVRQESIVEVYRLTTTEECVVVMLPNGATAAIRGTYESVMRQLNRPECKP